MAHYLYQVNLSLAQYNSVEGVCVRGGLKLP